MRNQAAFGGRGRRALRGPLGFAALISFLDSSSALAQCSLCRDAVLASPPEIRVAMNFAIIGLAFAPYVVGGLAAWILLPALRARVGAWFRGRIPRDASSPS